MNNEDNFGIFYTCYTEKQAVVFSLEKLFSIYPSIPVYLISDGGEDYSFLEKKYKTIKTYLEEDTRGLIPKITKESFLEEKNQLIIKKSILTLISRIERSIEFCNKKYILIMEPDVLVRGRIHIPSNSKLLGTKINSGLSENLKSILRKTNGSVEIDHWGATPAIFEAEGFLKAANMLKSDKNLFDNLCKADYRFSYYDVLLAVMFALIGQEETVNPEIIECFRNFNWENSSHPLVHQYRAKYPLSKEGYNGTHVINSNGLGDSWPWKR